MHEREMIDMAAYISRSQAGPCFVCALIAGDPDYHHHIIYEDDNAIAFLNKYPILYGYTIVAPRQHREQVTGDFTVDQYLALQRVIYRVGEAIQRVVPTERLYIVSIGSQLGNRHVHWHLAPLPSGVPYAEQQFQAMMVERGVLPLSDADMAKLALRISHAMQ